MLNSSSKSEILQKIQTLIKSVKMMLANELIQGHKQMEIFQRWGKNWREKMEMDDDFDKTFPTCRSEY